MVEHIDHGLAIAKKYKQSLRIVTLEGELINPGGSMTGGAFKNSSNLLSRRREMEEFERTVKQLKREMDEVEASSDLLRKERAGYYEKMDEINNKLQKAYVIQNTAKMNADQAAAKIRNSRELAESMGEEAKKLDDQITEIVDNQDSINVELDTSERLEQELTKQIEEEQKILDAGHEEEAGKVKRTEEIHLEFASLEQKFTFVDENENRIREEIGKFQCELKELEKNKGGTSKEIEEKEKQIQELKETIENSAELFVEIQAEIERFKKEREELNQKHKNFLQKREELSKHMGDLDKIIYIIPIFLKKKVYGYVSSS